MTSDLYTGNTTQSKTRSHICIVSLGPSRGEESWTHFLVHSLAVASYRGRSFLYVCMIS